MNKGVSCLCLTYGRPTLLEEAIESFIRQEWDGPKELLVLNDHPNQELVYKHKQVRIFNMRHRLNTLGEKRNLSVALARYDNLLIWDDDDIHLPWRIDQTMKAMADSHYFRCGEMWVWENGEFYLHTPQEEVWFHCASGYSRYLYEEVGGYDRINAGEDVDFETRLRSNERVSRFWRLSQLPLEQIYYIYRWSHGHYHTTGCMDLSRIEPKVKPGRYELKPHWKKDYCKEIDQHIKRMVGMRQAGGSRQA